MVIHHGEVAATSAGLPAEIPDIVIPLTADQPFWAQRVHGIGTRSKPIPVQKLSVENLTRSILRATDNAICKRAQSIGIQLRRQDGVGITIKIIENMQTNL